jgi:arsenate reductase (glutaredoxin)
MATLKVYSYKNCDTCRKALQWLEKRNVSCNVIAIREQPPGSSELQKMLKACQGNIRKLFNVSGQDYKALNMKDKLPGMSDAEAIQLLSKNGNMVKRPFVIGEGIALVGFKEEEWQKAFGRA